MLNNFTSVKQIINKLITRIEFRNVLLYSVIIIFIGFNSIKCSNQIRLLTQDNIHPLKNINIEVIHEIENGPYIKTLTYTFLNSDKKEEDHKETNWDNEKSLSHVYYLETSSKSYVELDGEETNIYVGTDMAKGMLQFNYNTRQE